MNKMNSFPKWHVVDDSHRIWSNSKVWCHRISIWQTCAGHHESPLSLTQIKLPGTTSPFDWVDVPSLPLFPATDDLVLERWFFFIDPTNITNSTSRIIAKFFSYVIFYFPLSPKTLSIKYPWQHGEVLFTLPVISNLRNFLYAELS